MVGILSAGRLLGSSAGFSPAYLFGAGEQGAWYDPSDISTLFQDTAGTTPVTATGQSVALIRDKSGRGNHASQGASANRPIYEIDANGMAYLNFDGSNDSLVTSSIDFLSANKMTVAVGLRKSSDTAIGVVVELSSDYNSNTGVFSVLAPLTAGGSSFAFLSKGSTSLTRSATGYSAPISSVVIGLADIGAPLSTLRINGTQVSQSSNTQGTGNYGNYPLYLGRRGGTTLPFNGRLYSLIVRGASSSPDEIAKMETWVNGKTGAY